MTYELPRRFSQVAAARYTPRVARFLVVVLIACSIALMGGTTCHVSTSSGKSKKDDGKSSSQTGSGVLVIVDNGTSIGGGGGSGGGSGASTDGIVIEAALATPLIAIPPPEAATPTPAPILKPEYLVYYASSVGYAIRPGTNPIPEPTAGLLFAAGLFVVALHLRRRTRRAGTGCDGRLFP